MRFLSTANPLYSAPMPPSASKTRDTETPGRRGQQVSDIVEALRSDIIAGRLPPASRLGQEQLAARFNVSRMPVREALRRLEADGLVIFEPNKSVRVAPLSAEDLQEIYEMRVAAETLAVRLALPELTNAQIERAAEIQAQMERAPVGAFDELNALFHMTLYRPCARTRLLAHIDMLGNAADRYLRITIASLDYADKSHREHHALLRACRRRDEAAAVDCLTRHIAEAGETLMAFMRRDGVGSAQAGRPANRI